MSGYIHPELIFKHYQKHQKMRICITRSEKNAYSETFIRNQISGLSTHADVWTIHSGRFPERSEDNSLLTPKLFWIIHKIIKPIVGRNNFFSNYGAKKYLKTHKIDLVWANYGMSGAHMVPVCKDINLPLITIFHGHDATDKKLLREYKNKYIDLFNYASSIIAVSMEMKRKLIKAGASDKKIKVIPYGIDIEEFKPVTDVIYSKHFITVGRFTAKKAPLHTINAFQQVLQKYPDAKLTMIGAKTGLFNACEKLVSDLGIQSSVVFTGILEPEKIAKMMRKSLAYVQHSVTAANGDMEGTPLSILEASASGIPVVSTKHGGIKEAIIHGETGYLVDENDINGMSNFMIKLCESPEKAKELGLNGRKHIIDNYERNKQILKLYKAAEEAISNKQ